MARVVFVHGVAQQNMDEQDLCEVWRAALNDGLADVAHAERGVSLTRDEVAMVFWGQLFAPTGAQGAGDTDPAEWDPQTAAVAEALAEEWLEHAAAAATVELREAAREGLAELRAPVPTGEPMGPGALVRRAVELAGRLRLSEQVAFPVMARVMRRSLYQVAVYLTDRTVRETVLAMVDEQVDEDTHVLVGHSLGSVIAFEACHRLDRPIPLLVTLGSPLGLKTIVYDRLEPSPPTFPPQVGHWVNVADPDDIVAARQTLSDLFLAEVDDRRLADHTVTNPGFWTHGISGYLNQASVAYPIERALT